MFLFSTIFHVFLAQYFIFLCSIFSILSAQNVKKISAQYPIFFYTIFQINLHYISYFCTLLNICSALYLISFCTAFHIFSTLYLIFVPHYISYFSGPYFIFFMMFYVYSALIWYTYFSLHNSDYSRVNNKHRDAPGDKHEAPAVSLVGAAADLRSAAPPVSSAFTQQHSCEAQ